MMLDLVETVSRLVAIPSVNPMGRTVSGPEFLETQLTDYLQTLFERLGLRHQRQPVEPGRENIIARLDGAVPPERGGQVVLFEAHQDTVPVDGMTIEPWTPTVDGGRLYGRGACDTKGGMGAMLVAVARLAEERPAGMPTVIMACTVNEEYGFTGATALTELFAASVDGIIPHKPDAVVVAEPTGLDVVVAHRGVMRWRCHTRGRAAHSAHPEAGENAIYKMARVLTAIERYAKDMVGRRGSHTTCGPATMSVGTIIGGVSVNTVPDLCTIEIDRRLPPGENLDEAYNHLVYYLEQQPETKGLAEHDPPYMRGPALSDEASGPVADGLAAIIREVTGDCRTTGAAYGTDAAAISAAGVPSVVFGPGSIEQAHTVDEWVSLDQLEQAAEVFYRFGRTGLRVDA